MLRLSSAATARLVAACRAARVSVHSALAVAVHYAHRLYLQQTSPRRARAERAADRNHHVRVPLGTTVDLRRRTTPPVAADVLGALAYSVMTSMDLDLARITPEEMCCDFWGAARVFYGQLQERLAAQDYWWLGAMFDALLPTRLLVRMLTSGQILEQPVVPLFMGNVGVIAPLPCAGGMTLQNMHVEFSNAASGMYVCAVTYQNQLSLSCHAQCPKDTLDEMLRLIHHVLQLVCDEKAMVYSI